MAEIDTSAVIGSIKDARHDTISATEDVADRLQGDIVNSQRDMLDRFFQVGRDTADLRAQVTSLSVYVKDAATISAQATQLAVAADGEKTRSLINDLKYQDLNRALIERNAELVEERHHGRRWFDNYNQAQWAALNSQVQALNSQFADARQGMVNFGTMAGVGQTSSQNNA